MPNQAHPAGFRALLAGGALLALLLCAVMINPNPASAAGISLINGTKTSIEKSPWQVALAFAERPSRPGSPRQRFFCGGSMITPDLVVTAGHCVADLRAQEVKRIEVIGGRTFLNDESSGTVTRAARVYMPLRPNGTRRYSSKGGGARWDVALVKLAKPVPGAATIKLAGEDEEAIWGPGQITSTTGWGVTSGGSNRASAFLRTVDQVMLPDKVCSRYDGRQFDLKTMACIGGPSGNTSTCSGDSGGPLVASVGLERRLVGLTSFGDAYCNAQLPSVDSRVSGDAMRSWVQRTALDLSGVDVVGSGLLSAPVPVWCRVPDLRGMTVNAARLKLLAGGCVLGKIERIRTFAAGSPRGRIFAVNYYPGWLAPLEAAIAIRVAK